jgi:nitrogen fixation protein FixH
MKRAKELKGIHVLASLLTFFGAVIAVNVYFIVKAIDSFPGEDEKKSYAQGLRYNDTLQDRARQRALGWRAVAALTPQSASGVRLEVRLLDRNGAPIDGLAISGELRRPADAKLDRALSFEARGAGLYVAKVPALDEGRWTLRAQARSASGHLDFGKAMIWQPMRS